MKIIHVACMPFPSMQGTQVYVRGLLNAEHALGHDVSLLCYGYGSKTCTDAYQLYRVANIGSYRKLRAGPDFYKIILYILITYKLWFLEADIIHVHNYEAPIAAYIRRLCRDTPIVYTAHNLMEEELGTYMSSSRKKKWASRLGRLLDHSIPRLADHVIAIHPKTKPRLVQLGCSAVSVITPGVERIEIPHGSFEKATVVYTGNLDAYQDLEIFLWLVRNHSKVSFQIITSSDPHLMYKEKPSNLEIVYTEDFSSVCMRLYGATLHVIPRRVCSGFPMKLLNSLILEVPVLGFASTLPQMTGVISVHNKEELSQKL